LGGTAAHSLFGLPMKILQNRGAIFDSVTGFKTLITVHPSLLLRLPEGVNVDEQFDLFVADLRKIKAAVS
jgi:DNA polymerase